MAYIRMGPESVATGKLREIFVAAIRRAGRVFNIVRTMSLNPPVLEASMALYMHAMKGRSGLTRKEREMLATVVSTANDCFY
jgi:alkylhydroperoxidase family enzyme